MIPDSEIRKVLNTFFASQELYLEKLEAFLLTLIEYNEVTKSELEGIKGNDHIDLSRYKDFEAIAMLISNSYEENRSYTIIFRDKAKAIEVGILLYIENSRITFFSAQMIRFKYGKSAGMVIRSDKMEKGKLVKIDKDALVKGISEFIATTK